MSYGQSSYGGGEYGSTVIIVQPERIELPALTIATALYAPQFTGGGVAVALEIPVLTISTTLHDPLVHEQSVPIARHVRRMRVGQRE